MNPSTSELRQSLSGKLYIFAAMVVLIVAGAYLWGWLIADDPFGTAFRGRVTMKANTAAAFMVAALLLSCARIRPRLLQAVVRWLLAVPLLVLGALTLLEYIFGLELPLDEVLVAAPNREIMTSSPGRMAPTTATAFMLFAIAMLIDHRQTGRARAWSRVTASAFTLIGLASVLGYAYGAPALYLGVDGVTAMSLPTSILFIVLGVGVIWIRAEYGFPAMLAEESVVGTHVRALVPIVVGTPILVGAAVAGGYGYAYEGPFAIALTSLGSVVAASIVATASIIILRRAESAAYVKDRALAATTTGIAITDHLHPNEPLSYVNTAFTNITGYSSDEIVGRNCRFLSKGAENSADVMANLRSCIDQSRYGTFEIQNVRSDGSLFWNRLSVAPVEDHEGRVTHFVGVLDDVTTQRKQEARLRSALDEARKANEMRNTFVRLVSHELRTPLNAALTWIRLMEVDTSEDIRNRGLRVVAQSIDSQSRLIDDLVDVTRFAAAGVRLEHDNVDVSEIVTTTTEELRPLIEPAQEFHVHIGDGNYSARLDPLRIRQVVRNLITNANKYTPPDGHINVHLEAAEEVIRLTVADSGKGLTREDIGKVFEPFWRAESHQPGLGVGLAIVAALVSAHSGTIEVQSAGVDKGSTFVVTLPRRQSSDDDVALHDTDALSATGTHAAAFEKA